MTPRVTVLLAVHNGEPYVRGAVVSVLAQTHRDFEFVIVDDASTDGTVATIESFGDKRIRLLRNEHNVGQVPSLNRGLREARGEIVARIDADDVSLPTRLERQLAVLDADPRVGLVGSWMALVDARGRRVGSLRKTLKDYVDFLFHTLIMRVWVSHPAAAYRRESILALGGYDEATGPAEDKDLWRKLALERWDARIVPEELVLYRLHDGQLSQTRAAFQREVDARSQERFLSALAPGAPTAEVRMLLADDPGWWQASLDARATAAGIDDVLAGAGERLELANMDWLRLRELVGRRLIAVSARRPWAERSRIVALHGLSMLPRGARRAALTAVVPRAAVAPARVALVAATRRLGATAPSLRRWRVARRLYSKLLGGG
jgi:glycosyltransferase involved in cell wall biosynthesis